MKRIANGEFEKIRLKFSDAQIVPELLQLISSVSATQFTVEKSDFEWFAMIDRNCFCSTTSNFAQSFTQKKTLLESLTGELNASNKVVRNKSVL